nr:transposase [Pseudoalteromonas sp. NZS100]
MMPVATARKRQISLSNTRYYHCISRCVRRAYLCGIDTQTGKSYEHRRDWVEERLLFLAKVFCIDICAYAVMSNHTHLVLYIDDKKANRLTDRAVCIRWHKAFKGTNISKRYLEGESLSDIEKMLLKHSIVKFRNRLKDISWFMRSLNENIARQANKEDDCTGRFWEGRFKSQALLDEPALLACMAYVDLNPIRAKVSQSIQTSSFTSIKKRIEHAIAGNQPKFLAKFVGKLSQKISKGLPFEFKNYLELVEQTGKCIRADKPGYINQSTTPILKTLNITEKNWLKLTTRFTKIFHGAVGKAENIEIYCNNQHFKRRPNIKNSQALTA